MSEVNENKKSKGRPKRNGISKGKGDNPSNAVKRKADEMSENQSTIKKSCADVNNLTAPLVRIEHWAEELIAAVKPAYPQLEFSLNPTKPRRGAFEFVLLDQDGKENVIWSGLKRGPPRKEKFPEPDALVDLFKVHLDKE